MSAQTLKKTKQPASKKTAATSSIVVFASGRGSNFRAICEAAHAGKLNAQISALVTNVAGAGACDVAREFNIPVLEIPNSGETRSSHEAKVFKALSKISFDWIVLAGYMRLFTPLFIQKFWDKRLGAARILNIHPSLLPSFPGTDGYGQALRYGVKITGATVHFVGDGLDDGPIIAQRAIEVRDDDTEVTLSTRGLRLEHELYVQALQSLVEKPFKVSTGNAKEGRLRVVLQ